MKVIKKLYGYEIKISCSYCNSDNLIPYEVDKSNWDAKDYQAHHQYDYYKCENGHLVANHK